MTDGKAIEILRLIANVSQKELANKIGISAGYLSVWEGRIK
jgi:transcriptional regulator with XRE-family HTH domain